MLTNPRNQDDIVIGDENISADARVVAEQAATVVKQWIDGRIAELTKQTQTELKAANNEFDMKWKELEASLEATTRDIDAIVAQVSALKLALTDDARLRSIVADLDKSTKAVQAELDRRKKLFREGGGAVASALGKALKAIAL